MQCKSNAKLGSGVRYLKQNKQQLLYRMQSIQISLIYNKISIFENTMVEFAIVKITVLALLEENKFSSETSKHGKMLEQSETNFMA